MLNIHGLAITAMACPEPEGVMDQEQAYVAALTAAAGYRLADGRLELQNAVGEMVLVFERQEVYEASPDDLLGTAWQLVSLDGQPPIDGSMLTLAFHDGRWASGYAGCREYVATYQARGGDLGFGYTAMLGAECGQEALLGQEGNFTTVLGWTAHYRLTGGQLELVTIRGETLAFAALPSEEQPALEGPTWTLLSFIEPNPLPDSADVLPMPADVLPGTEITILFEGGQAGGSAGCNHYGTTYTRADDSLALAAIAATEMACLSPEGVMEQEQRYFEILGAVTSAHVYAGQLWLATDDGRALVFVAPDPASKAVPQID